VPADASLIPPPPRPGSSSSTRTGVRRQPPGHPRRRRTHRHLTAPARWRLRRTTRPRPAGRRRAQGMEKPAPTQMVTSTAAGSARVPGSSARRCTTSPANGRPDERCTIIHGEAPTVSVVGTDHQLERDAGATLLHGLGHERLDLEVDDPGRRRQLNHSVRLRLPPPRPHRAGGAQPAPGAAVRSGFMPRQPTDCQRRVEDCRPP
jgi:hypothetical protein